ncbi:MAG: hypothetical protein JWM49_2921 [Microbacteriaceae bacterium]|nr:hypothetical protein [Microbacteriaceae bacterium]
MTSRARAVGLFAAIIIVATVAVVILVNVLTPPVRTAPIESIRYNQTKTEPGFDDSTHTVTDRTRVAAFSAIVKKYSIDVGHFDSTLNDECTGGLATNIAVTLTDHTVDRLSIYDCGRTVPRGTFVSDATALFTSWSAQGR